MMRNRTLFLLVMAATVLVSSQAWAHDLPQPSVDLTTRIARTAHNGLRAIKNPPSKMIDFATKQASEPEAQTAISAARTDASTMASRLILMLCLPFCAYAVSAVSAV